MVFAHQIRQVIADYLSDRIKLEGFAERFAPLSYNILKDGQHEAIRLANAAEGLLVNLRANCINEQRFRAMLRDLTSLDATNVFIDLSFSSPVNQYSVEETAFPAAVVPFGTSREMGPWSVTAHQV
jgi:hypothetical protein